MARVAASDPGLGPFFDYEVGRITQGHLPCGICRNPEEE